MNLDNIQVVLCNTSHQGNIGASARAMKTMGLSRLVLVNPKNPPDDHAIALACNAHLLVSQALIVDNLDKALAASSIRVALSARRREFSAHIKTPKELLPDLLQAIYNNQQISLVFGNEQHGLSITEQEKCNYLVSIPANPEYSSLNLAQAVQILCYEIYANYRPELDHNLINSPPQATHLDTQYLLTKINYVMTTKSYFKNKNQERFMRRLQQIIHKAKLEREDVDLLHGILNQTYRTLR